MQREYTAVFKRDGKWTMAWIEEVPGALTQGRTKKEARENLREALSLILEERAKVSKKGTSVERESFRIEIDGFVHA